jgi:hypothetical protein
MINGILKLANRLGWTRTARIELSDIISQETEVKSKSEKDEYYVLMSSMTGGYENHGGMPHYYPVSYPESGYAGSGFKCTKKCLTLEGGSRLFELNNSALYDSVREGDRVSLRFKDMYEVVYDFLDGDYSKRQIVSRKLVGYEIVGTQPL